MRTVAYLHETDFFNLESSSLLPISQEQVKKDNEDREGMRKLPAELRTMSDFQKLMCFEQQQQQQQQQKQQVLLLFHLMGAT